MGREGERERVGGIEMYMRLWMSDGVVRHGSVVYIGGDAVIGGSAAPRW